MKHDPIVRQSACENARRGDCGPGPAQLLGELERRCLVLRAGRSGRWLDPLLARLDAFAIIAADLIDSLSAPEAVRPLLRRGFDLALADVDAAFEQLAADSSPLARLMIPGDGGETSALADIDLIATLAPIQADAARLHQALTSELRALLYPGISDPLDLRLIDAGFAEPIRAAQRLRAWQQGAPDALRDTSEQNALADLMPRLIGELERFEHPDATLAALDEIISRLPADVSLFAACDAQPPLIASLLGLLGHAPDLSRHLLDQPALIGRLIDGSIMASLPAPADLDAELFPLMQGDDRQVPIARAVGAHRFALGFQLLAGGGDPLDLAAAHCYLAEAALRAMATDVLADMRNAHGEVPGSDLVILALGRFGGGALTGNSDLDIIYLFTGDGRAQSNGRRPLDANEYFSRVAQRITTAMSTVTMMGPLYEIDTRLRPWGAKGLLACSVETFERYHRENAWTWEHMALTRARPVFGADGARRAVKTVVKRTLHQYRNRADLVRDAAKMRGDMARHKPARGPFDVKLVTGGLVDLEFAVHVHQLGRHVGIQPHLRTAIRAQVKAGLIDPAVITAHETLSRLLMAIRLLSPHSQTPAPEQRRIIARACGFSHWDMLEAAYGEARVTVMETWQAAIADNVQDG